MRTFKLKDSGQVLSEHNYRLMYPNVSFSEKFIPTDAWVVVETPEPFTMQSQTCVKDGVELISDVWCTKWKVIDVTPDEVPLWKLRSVLDTSELGQVVYEFINGNKDKHFTLLSNNRLTYSPVILRSDNIFKSMLRQGKISAEQIDELFITAFRLES